MQLLSYGSSYVCLRQTCLLLLMKLIPALQLTSLASGLRQYGRGPLPTNLPSRLHTLHTNTTMDALAMLVMCCK